jgi:sugar phosphate permease
MHAVWHLIVIWGVLVGIGSGLVAMASAATLVNRWFARNRGLVLGLLSASTATGQLIFLPFLASLIAKNGWRSAALLIVLAAAAAVPLIILFMRGSPSEVGLLPFGASAAAQPAQPVERFDFRAALFLPLQTLKSACAKRDFWLLAGSFFVCGASTNGLIGTHLVPACVDAGMPEVRAAGLLAIMGIFDIFGTSLSGLLSDWIDARALLCCYYGLRGLSLLLLPWAITGPSHVLGIFTVFYGLDWIATVPPTVQLCGRIFGHERSPIVFGWVFVAHQFGAASAASIAGTLRVNLGDYNTAFLGAGLLCLATALLVLFIGTYEPRARVESAAYRRGTEAVRRYT